MQSSQQNHKMLIKTETTTTKHYLTTENKEAILSRITKGIQENSLKIEEEIRTKASKDDSLIESAWSQAKRDGTWVSAKDAILLDVLEDEISSTDGLMRNPVESKLVTYFRKREQPQGTYYQRKMAKRHQTFYSHHKPPKMDPPAHERLGFSAPSQICETDYTSYGNSHITTQGRKELSGIKECDYEGSSLPRRFGRGGESEVFKTLNFESHRRMNEEEEEEEKEEKSKGSEFNGSITITETKVKGGVSRRIESIPVGEVVKGEPGEPKEMTFRANDFLGENVRKSQTSLEEKLESKLSQKVRTVRNTEELFENGRIVKKIETVHEEFIGNHPNFAEIQKKIGKSLNFEKERDEIRRRESSKDSIYVPDKFEPNQTMTNSVDLKRYNSVNVNELKNSNNDFVKTANNIPKTVSGVKKNTTSTPVKLGENYEDLNMDKEHKMTFSIEESNFKKIKKEEEEVAEKCEENEIEVTTESQRSDEKVENMIGRGQGQHESISCQYTKEIFYSPTKTKKPDVEKLDISPKDKDEEEEDNNDYNRMDKNYSDHTFGITGGNSQLMMERDFKSNFTNTAQEESHQFQHNIFNCTQTNQINQKKEDEIDLLAPFSSNVDEVRSDTKEHPKSVKEKSEAENQPDEQPFSNTASDKKYPLTLIETKGLEELSLPPQSQDLNFQKRDSNYYSHSSNTNAKGVERSEKKSQIMINMDYTSTKPKDEPKNIVEIIQENPSLNLLKKSDSNNSGSSNQNGGETTFTTTTESQELKGKRENQIQKECSVIEEAEEPKSQLKPQVNNQQDFVSIRSTYFHVEEPSYMKPSKTSLGEKLEENGYPLTSGRNYYCEREINDSEYEPSKVERPDGLDSIQKSIIKSHMGTQEEVVKVEEEEEVKPTVEIKDRDTGVLPLSVNTTKHLDSRNNIDTNGQEENRVEPSPSKPTNSKNNQNSSSLLSDELEDEQSNEDYDQKLSTAKMKRSLEILENEDLGLEEKSNILEMLGKGKSVDFFQRIFNKNPDIHHDTPLPGEDEGEEHDLDDFKFTKGDFNYTCSNSHQAPSNNYALNQEIRTNKTVLKEEGDNGGFFSSKTEGCLFDREVRRGERKELFSSGGEPNYQGGLFNFFTENNMGLGQREGEPSEFKQKTTDRVTSEKTNKLFC